MEKIIGNDELRYLGFNMPVGTSWENSMLNKAKEELSSASDLANADDIKLEKL